MSKGNNPRQSKWLLLVIIVSGLAARLLVAAPGHNYDVDNFAILLGLVSALLIGDDFDKPLNRRRFLGLSILGLSLMTKHIFFAFPFWLAVKQRGTLQKCAVILLPVSIFILGFVPYWNEGK